MLLYYIHVWERGPLVLSKQEENLRLIPGLDRAKIIKRLFLEGSSFSNQDISQNIHLEAMG